MEKHYYRTPESSELGKLLRKFLHDCDTAERQADNYCQKAGAQTFYGDESQMAGGVLCVGFGDQQPDPQLWRSIGKDGDGMEMYEPNCQRRQDCIISPRRDFRPSDTATRIYQRRPSRWQEVVSLHTKDEWIALSGINQTGDKDCDWERAVEHLHGEMFFRYIEIYYDDKQRDELANTPHYHLPFYMRRAIRLEIGRIKLPVVSIQSLYSLLRLQPPADQKFIKAVQPVIFLHYGRYYLAIDHPCSHPDLEAITEGVFQMKRVEFQRLLNSPELAN